MSTQVTKWTITSPTGQILCGELEDNGDVNMSSAKGNHGQVSLDVWMSKVEQMVKMGYKVETK